MMEAQLAPLNIARVVVALNRRLVGFKIDLVNRPSSMASVLALTSKYNFNVLCSVVEALAPSDERASMLLILDATEAFESPERLMEELGKLPEVIGVRMAKPEIEGLFIDPFHFPVLIGVARGMAYTCGTFISMAERVRRELGSAGEAILFYEGVAAGEALDREWRPLLPGFSREQMLASMLRVLRSLGWLNGEVVEWDESKPEIVVRAYDLFECCLVERKDRPNSQFFRGLLSGLVSSLLRRDMVAVETLCVAKGDAFCEFVVKPKEA